MRSRGLDRDVGAGADRDAEVGLRERRRVVDAVADHRDDAALAPAGAGRRRPSRPAAPRRSPRRCRPRRRRARAVASLSPVSSTGRRPSSRSCATASALVGLTVSATTNSARASPSQPATTAVVPAPSASRRARSSSARQLERPARRAAPGGRRRRACPSTTPSTPRPARLREALDRGQRAGRARGARSPARSGARSALSSAPTSRSASSRSTPVGGATLDERHAPARDRAGLVEHDRVDAARRLEHLRALDQDAELRAAAGADEQRGRRGEAERARAGDDQHGDRGGEGERGAARRRRARSRASPAASAITIGTNTPEMRSASRCTGALPDCASVTRRRDLRERGVGADARRAHDEAAADVDVAPATSSPGLDLDRHALAGQQRPVDRRAPVLDDAVGGDLLARAHDEAVADDELARSARAARAPSSSSTRDLLGAELEQRPQRRARAALGARLEVAPGEDEDRRPRPRPRGRSPRARAAVERRARTPCASRLAGAEEEERHDRPAPRGERADRDQRVHRRRAVPQVRPARRGGTASRPRARPASRAGAQSHCQ